MIEEKVAAPGAASASTSPPAGQPGFFERTFQAFRYRDFSLMWSGAFTSTTGTWMQTVAQSWLVLDLAGAKSAVYLGLLGSLTNIPYLLFSLVGGVVADRVDRRVSLLASQYTQMTCAFILTLLVYFHVVQVWHMMILVFIAGTGMAFGGPAYSALVPGLVPRKDLSNAVALNSIQFNLARVIGPVLAGIAMGSGLLVSRWLGPYLSGLTVSSAGGVVCFFLNGLSFLAVIASLYMIRSGFQPVKTKESMLDGIKAGFKFIRERGALWQLTVLGFVSTFCGIPLLTLLPVVARNTFHLDAQHYSYMLSTSGIGSILGALTYAGLSNRKKQGLLALRVQLTFAVLLGVFAFSKSLPLSYVCLFFSGMCLLTLFASITSLVQLMVTEEMRGRVMSIFNLAFRCGMVFGDPVAGYLANQFSPARALLSLSILLACTASGFLLSSSGVKEL